jgi:hypothetical protein
MITRYNYRYIKAQISTLTDDELRELQKFVNEALSCTDSEETVRSRIITDEERTFILETIQKH